jgi:hypothetical protein
MGLLTLVALGLVAGAIGSLETQAPPPPAPSLTGQANDYAFGSATGLLIFHVRPDKTGDFEAVALRIAEGLEGAADPLRRQQARGWRVLRSSETAAGVVLYVALIDPVVPGADYDPVRMITELLPGESTSLYERLREAVLKVERIGLTAIR